MLLSDIQFNPSELSQWIKCICLTVIDLSWDASYSEIPLSNCVNCNLVYFVKIIQWCGPNFDTVCVIC